MAVVAVALMRVHRIGSTVPTGTAENNTVSPLDIIAVMFPAPPTYTARVMPVRLTVSLVVIAAAYSKLFGVDAIEIVVGRL